MRTRALAVAALTLAFLSGSAEAADGDLDVSYDTDGVNSVSFGVSDNVYGGLLQTDGTATGLSFAPKKLSMQISRKCA